jgi:2,3-dihydroxy-p-cumate/2,3-dihydroxybenzoate 3,4-dioxygenase
MSDHPIRFARLGYCRLRCPDLGKSVTFYRDLVGLSETVKSNGTRWMRCGDKPYDLILEGGDAAGLAGVGYELESAAELDAAFTHLSALGHAPDWADADRCAAYQVERALLVRDPVTGMELDFYSGQAQADADYEGGLTKIARLGHVVMNVTDLAAAHDFWVDQLGFAVSDRVEGVAEWLRAWPNPLHHSLALLQGERNTLHHINFMVTDIDDIGAAMNRLKAADVPIVFGPGRHLPSTSIFLYFLDPDGNPAEFSFGMELFEEIGAREARVLEHKAEVMDIWGSKPDPRFGKGSPIVAADA